jgi:hypothetical protein
MPAEADGSEANRLLAGPVVVAGEVSKRWGLVMVGLKRCWLAAVLALVITGCGGVTPPACPGTQPNGSLPLGEQNASPDYLGNGDLWTVLWPERRIEFEPDGPGDFRADGSLAMKFPFWWGDAAVGDLSITGMRLDGAAPGLTAEDPEGYGGHGFHASALVFPTAGCWEITATAGGRSLSFTTEVVVRQASDG